MRVLHIITRMIVGGAQENTLYNCKDLVRNFGDTVCLLTGPSLGAEGDLLAHAAPEGVEVSVEPALIRSIRPLTDWQAYLRIKKFIKDWKPDVVHTHSAKGGLIGRFAATHCRVPCVIHTVHGAPFHSYQNALSRNFFIACERLAARNCHHLISVADAMTDLMVDANVAERSKFTTIYSGMEVDPFLQSDNYRQVMREKLGFGDHDIVFGKIARLFHLKGHEYLVTAARRLVAVHPNAKFLLVGDGILQESLQQQIATAGLQDHFVFAGLVPPVEIPRYLGAMDVLVHTSLREGLARALPQGLIAGKPTISFDVDGAREVVINGETGCLVPPLDTENLADAMIKLASSAELRSQLGAEGRRRFVEQFRHEHMSKRIREVYKAVLDRRIGHID